jgi:hypothetical protein
MRETRGAFDASSTRTAMQLLQKRLIHSADNEE